MLAASNLALPAAAILTGPLLARELGPSGRGELAAVLAPLALVTLLLDLGLPQSVTYVVATGRATVREASRLALAVGGVAGAVAAGGVVALTPVLLRRYPGAQDLLVVLALTLPVIMGVGLLRHVAQGLGRFDLMARERLTTVVVRTTLIVVLSLAGTLTVAQAAWSTHGIAVLATFVLLPVLRLRGQGTPAREEGPVLPFMLNYGMRTWLGTVSGVLLLRLDQVLLAPLAGARQLGFYAVAVSIAEVPAIALMAIRDVVFAESATRADPGLAARAVRSTLVVAVPSCVLGIVLAPVAVPLLFGEPFRPAVEMTQVLFVAMIPGAVSTVLVAGLFSVGRPGLASWAQGIAAGVTVVALVLLVPELGGIGAAYASLAAYATAAVLVVFWFVRATSLPVREVVVPRRTDVTVLAERLGARMRRRRQKRDAAP